MFAVSAATIDRMLTPVRKSAGLRRKRRASKKVSKEIPIKTFSDWKDPLPGFLEMDFVVHGGGSMAGEYLHSLVLTDVCSGWVEAVPLLAREQTLVVEGLKRIRKQMPVAMGGIDSDNDGAFINDTLASYCKQEGIVFTRSRVHHKNDQAWIEQKNGAVIRKMVGHQRFSGIVAGQALAQLLQAVRLYVNYFQPSFKLRERLREGSRVKKLYHPPATPCDRLLAHEKVDDTVKAFLRKQHAQLEFATATGGKISGPVWRAAIANTPATDWRVAAGHGANACVRRRAGRERCPGNLARRPRPFGGGYATARYARLRSTSSEGGTRDPLWFNNEILSS